LPVNTVLEPLFVVVSQQQLLCQKGSQQIIYELGQLPFKLALAERAPEALSVDFQPRYLLGLYNQRPCYAVSLPINSPCIDSTIHIDSSVPKDFGWRTLRSFLSHVDDLHFDLAGRACQIVSWDREHRFCGCCGQQTAVSQTDYARTCHNCERQFYPRISPCVIVVISRDNHCLLARNTSWERNYFSALSGFIEPGETVEQALHREVKEEVGIAVKNLPYFSSQPWPFPGELMWGFHAEYQSGEIQVYEKEIAEADWLHYQNLEPCPGTHTLSGRLIEHFVNQCTVLSPLVQD
jgi:NAD+ diphosphatase